MNTINVTQHERDTFERLRSRSPQLQRLLGEKSSPGYADLIQDAFAAFYKYYPELKAEVPPAARLNRSIIEAVMGLREYEQLRALTQGDAENAASALDRVRGAWAALPAAVTQAQDDAEQAAAELDAALNGEGDLTAEELRLLCEELNEAGKRVAAEVDEYADEIRQVVRQAVAEAEDDVADGETACAALGWTKNGGPPQGTAVDDKMRIAAALQRNAKLRDIVREAGRLTNIADKRQRQKAQYTRTEIVGIEQGDDLASVVPSEFGYFVHGDPALRAMFLKRLSQGELLQYEMDAREPQGKGPIIVGLDCSGSMSGQPDVWSKAMALAMYSIARRQQRDFAVVLFNHAVVREVIIRKGEHRADDLIALLTAGVGGGTSFEEPLNHALKLITESKFDKADVIMVTDGVCDVTDDFQRRWAAARTERGFQTTTILIGGSIAERSTAAKFSDTVVELGDMIGANEDAAFSAAFTI